MKVSDPAAHPMLEAVADSDDPRLDDYRDVKDPQWLRRRDIFLAEGRVVVLRLLESTRFRVRSLLLTETALKSLGNALDGHTFPIYRVDREVLEGVAGVRFHQGCVAVAERPAEPSTQEILLGLGDSAQRLLVLEGVADPDNVGGLFRNALAFGVAAVLLGPGCAHPLYRKSIRTSMGATLQVRFASMVDWPKDLSLLRAAGFSLIALTPSAGALDIRAFGTARPVPERVALLLGDEGYGLSKDALAACELRVRIDMTSEADSLNVATAAAIALHRLT